ncbi:hypothetical protein [Actinophytocola sediminis]
MTPVPLDPVTRHCLLLLVHDELVAATAARLADGAPPRALAELVARRAAALTEQLGQATADR